MLDCELQKHGRSFVQMKELFLKTCDNVKIAINQYESGFKEALIMAHGWFMTKDSKSLSDMANIFAKNMDVIVMDFRGHGRSSGAYTFTTKEVIDLKTVVDWAKERYEKVYLMGFSLGGALVVIHSAMHKDVDKVIAISAPHSFERIENCMWRKEAWLPTLQKFELKRWLSVRPSLIIREKIKPIDVVHQIEAPTLFIAGSKDPTVYCWHTESLYDKAVCEKQLEIFKDCYHAEDLFLQDEANFINVCENWLIAEKRKLNE